MHTAKKNKSKFSKNCREKKNKIPSLGSPLLASSWRDKSESNWLICDTGERGCVPAVLYLFSDVLHFYFIILTMTPLWTRPLLTHIWQKAKDYGSRSDWTRQSKGKEMKRLYCWIGFPQMILCHCWLIVLLLGSVYLQKSVNQFYFFRTMEASVDLSWVKQAFKGIQLPTTPLQVSSSQSGL